MVLVLKSPICASAKNSNSKNKSKIHRVAKQGKAYHLAAAL